MDIKDVKLKKGMSRDEVNELISEWVLLEDEEYIESKFKHKWLCTCGDVVVTTWDIIRRGSIPTCSECRRNKIINNHRNTVNKIDGLKYVKTYFKGEIIPGGKVAKEIYVSFKHMYCNNINTVIFGSLLNSKKRCTKCCVSYENSFAHYIEVELGEPLEKYWDFDKNTVNPYHISKSMNATNRNGDDLKVWIKCANKEYHESYDISCNGFVSAKSRGNSGCTFCNPRMTKTLVHPKDSFAQYHIDNTDKDFLEKYWDYDKNTVNPWEISPRCYNKVWIKCQSEEVNELNGLMKKDYHGSYEMKCSEFTRGRRCGYCQNKKIHIYDSFGYHNFDKALSWHNKNGVSPFRVAKSSGKKYRFVCQKCGKSFEKNLCDITNNKQWCVHCSTSKGENRIKEFLDAKGVQYIQNMRYSKLLGVNNRKLSYDLYLPKYNTLIEYQGEFHDGTASIQTEEGYLKQQEHDRRKREYAINNNIELLEIWYWDFDNIEEILEEKLINNNKLI